MRYLIDADIVAFKAASAAEKPINWGDGLWTLHAYEQEAQAYVYEYFARLINTLGDGELCLFLTSPDNWRKDILPTYKSNRKDARKPMVLPTLKQWMMDTMNAVMVPTLEADDLLGIEATKDGGIIISEDKDLKTIPCTLFNPAKDKEPHEITEFDADYNHMYQTLTGDSTDGYSGCPTVGPKKAGEILKGCTSTTEMWAAVVAAYEKQNLSEEVALTMAQVSRICRVEDFDFDSMKVIPWTPKTT